VVPEGLALQPAVDELERKLILRALVAADDNKAQAARLLGISERTLWYKAQARRALLRSPSDGLAGQNSEPPGIGASHRPGPSGEDAALR